MEILTVFPLYHAIFHNSSKKLIEDTQNRNLITELSWKFWNKATSISANRDISLTSVIPTHALCQGVTQKLTNILMKGSIRP